MSSNSEEESAYSFSMQLIHGTTLAAALKSATELDLLELIKKAGRPVSAVELAAQIPTTNPAAPAMLDRILRLLAANNVLECHGGGVERLYSLPPHSELLTHDDAGQSLVSALLMFQDKIFMETWNQLKDAVLEAGTPFDRAFGMNGFEYTAKDPKFSKLFNRAMYEQSTMFMKKIVEIYKGFDGLKSLVDVGGGTGASLKMILSKYPSIKAINFDLPHVIQDAPSHPGVEHVGGDMFDSIPRGDAIFMKSVCHDWGDAKCLKILTNCYKALPDNGKVIIAETIISEIPSKNPLSASTTTSFFSDVIMMLFNADAKERTEKEFQTLAKATGFKEFKKIYCAFGYWIMELYK